MSRKPSLPIEESNESSQKSEKLRMIQNMRNQYMNTKQVDEIYEKEKQQFLQTRSNMPQESYLKSSSNSLKPSSSSSSSTSGSASSSIDHHTDQLLQQLTYKLTSHIQENIRKEQMNSQLQEKEVCQTILSRIDDFVTSELSSFLCPICFEIMAPPSRLPMLLFPCGHTFCQSCLDQHFQKRSTTGKEREKIPSNKTCPYCR
jgi:DNA-binding transcriptional MerR regulator